MARLEVGKKTGCGTVMLTQSSVPSGMRHDNNNNNMVFKERQISSTASCQSAMEILRET